MKLTYTKYGDYFVPNVIIHLPRRPLGIWGLRRKWYLQDNCPILYNQLVLEEKLYNHCLGIEDAALSRMEQILPALARDAGATDELKSADQMKWGGLMNACKN